jgi:hypothetical protein
LNCHAHWAVEHMSMQNAGAHMKRYRPVRRGAVESTTGDASMADGLIATSCVALFVLRRLLLGARLW